MDFNEIDFTGHVLLYSVQSSEQVENLNRYGYLTGNKDYLLFDGDYRDQYQWMIDRMFKRSIVIPNELLSKAKDNIYPVWSWYLPFKQDWCVADKDINRKDKSKLREWLSLSDTDTGCLLVFKKRWCNVLLSDFELWHFVLNGWLIEYNDHYRYIGEEIKHKYPNGCCFNDLPKEYQESVRESWDIIFDMTFNDPDFTEPFDKKIIQGVTWLIRREEIIDIIDLN